jgi:PAS domain S-box-containing protein
MLTRFWPFDFKGTAQNDEQVLATIFDNTADSLAIYDREHRIIKVNQAFTNLYQIPAKKLIGKYCYKAIYNRNARCHGCYIGDVFVNGGPKTWEEQRSLPDGRVLNFEVLASPIRNRKGITTLAFQQRRDITEQKHREKQLRESEKRFEIIMEMGRQGVFVLDTKARITYNNDRLAEMLGYLPEEITGRPFFNLMLDAPPSESHLDRNIANLRGTKETKLRKKDGGQMTVRMSMSTLKGDAGHTNLVGIISDISQLRALEEEYSAVKEINEKIINSIADSLIIIDPNNYRIVQANDHFLARMGVKSKEVLQETCYKILHGRSAPCETYAIACPVRETALKNRSTTVNRVYQDNEAKKRTIQVVTYPLHDSRGRVSRVIRIEHDVTYKLRIQDELLSQKDGLVKIQNQMKSLYEISTHLSVMGSLPKLVDYIYKISKGIYSESDFLLLILNAARDGFGHLTTGDDGFTDPHQDLRAKLDQGGRLADFAAYLNNLKPQEIVSIGSSNLPPPLKPVTEDYTTSLGLPVFSQSQCIGYFLVVSNSAQKYEVDDIHFFHTLFAHLAGHIRQLAVRASEDKRLSQQTVNRTSFENIIGCSNVMQKVYNLIEQVADSDATVLITGENGTGKELIAQAIHRMGPKRDGPFIVANCSAFASNLLESEIFGHEKGSFTGAFSRKKGRIELAHNGTLFLDEVGSVSIDTQVLLLRFLQNHCFERVGGEQTIRADVRVLAATNRDLQQEVQSGRFRSDFFYRLNVISIHLPPLRERREDIPLLSNHFLKQHSLAEGKQVAPFTPEIMQIIMNYDWPGNIRQLENAIHHAVILAQGGSIKRNDLPDFLTQNPDTAISDSLVENERRLILRVLRESRWNKHEAARRLEISRSTLYSKIHRHNLYKEELYEI